ncbi:hypothetical protein BpHYR1_036870 [Brachionus plicatilis]|uniref:Uncharacterized protein n=1 Tax=Brachionus plicatilis TaxID=10195 RepID=A0A3M7R107_BRAPC|nr:hypothetical protein BpHYR1_036870 [Brachionus plicatilis]
MTSLIIENLLLDLRDFLDDALTFIEFYEANEREPNIKFTTNNEEIVKLKQSLEKFANLMHEIKTQLSCSFIHEFNSSIEYSQNFKRKKKYFFNTMLKRLFALECNLKTFDCKNEVLKNYFKTIQKLLQKVLDFIGYLESNRWHKSIAFEILDQICSYSSKNQICGTSNELFHKDKIKKSSKANRKQKKNLFKKFSSFILKSSKSRISDFFSNLTSVSSLSNQYNSLQHKD